MVYTYVTFADVYELIQKCQNATKYELLLMYIIELECIFTPKYKWQYLPKNV